MLQTKSANLAQTSNLNSLSCLAFLVSSILTLLNLFYQQCGDISNLQQGAITEQIWAVMEEDISPWPMFEHQVILCRFWKDKCAQVHKNIYHT